MQDEGELERIRAAIDVCNRRLAAVLHERARLVRRIGAVKSARGIAAVDAEREQRMLAAVLRDLPPDGFAPDALAAIFAAVFAASRGLVATSA